MHPHGLHRIFKMYLKCLLLLQGRQICSSPAARAALGALRARWVDRSAAAYQPALQAAHPRPSACA